MIRKKSYLLASQTQLLQEFTEPNIQGKESLFVQVCSTTNPLWVICYSCRWRKVNYLFSLQWIFCYQYLKHAPVVLGRDGTITWYKNNKYF